MLPEDFVQAWPHGGDCPIPGVNKTNAHDVGELGVNAIFDGDAPLGRDDPAARCQLCRAARERSIRDSRARECETLCGWPSALTDRVQTAETQRQIFASTHSLHGASRQQGCTGRDDPGSTRREDFGASLDRLDALLGEASIISDVSPIHTSAALVR